MSSMDPTTNGVNSCVSYKTSAMLLINTVKYGKSIGSDRGKKTYTQKVKDPLSFEIWLIRW